MTAVAEPTAAEPTAEIGKARRRKEDAHLITGRTRWTDNITLPGMQHIAVLRSPMAHARIISIDTGAAKSAPGVVGAWTGEDLSEQGGLPCAWPITPDMKSPVHNPVAVGTVKHAGEIVAVVAARSKAEAVDAVELIDVEYDALPVVTDMNAALADGATLIHPDLETNRNAVWVFDSGQAGTGGNVEEALTDRRGRRRPDRRRAHLPAATPAPGVHGAAVDGGGPDRRWRGHVVVDAGPAHPAS